MEAPWRLFLNNLLFTATKQQVQEVLEEYGVGYGVEYIHIPRKGSVIDGVKHTIAFITYEQKDQVEAAVLALHDKILDPISTYPVAAMHARSRTSGKAYPHQVWQPWPSPKGNNAGPHSGGDEKANDGGETKETKGEESKEEKATAGHSLRSASLRSASRASSTNLDTSTLSCAWSTLPASGCLGCLTCPSWVSCTISPSWCNPSTVAPKSKSRNNEQSCGSGS